MFFSIQELYDMQPTQKYNEIISAINIDLTYAEVSKETKVGAPTELNYPAMIISFFIRYVKRIPTIVCVKLFSVDLSHQYFWHSIFVRFFLPRYACLLLLIGYVLKTKNLTYKEQDIIETL